MCGCHVDDTCTYNVLLKHPRDIDIFYSEKKKKLMKYAH